MGSAWSTRRVSGCAAPYLARRFPDLAGAPVVETRVCQYETTPDSQFVIDRHPDFDNVWLVGGGSGHGFKHGPMIGRHVVERLNGVDLREGEERFGLGHVRTAGTILRTGSFAMNEGGSAGSLGGRRAAGHVLWSRLANGERTGISGKSVAASVVGEIQSTRGRLTMIVETSRATIVPATS